MLTHNDKTVSNAYKIFDCCKNSKVQYWGFKEEGLPARQMQELFAYMKACGKTTVLEVVSYTEDACLQGAMLAVACNCDILMGTMFYDSVNDYCNRHQIKYMPFVGRVKERPSVLEGEVSEMTEAAKEYIKKGVYGFDLLAYRHKSNPSELIEAFVSQTDAPVCVAGSIDSYEKIDMVMASGAWAFTIGGAFFEHRFGESFEEQIERVCQYIENDQEISSC